MPYGIVVIFVSVVEFPEVLKRTTEGLGEPFLPHEHPEALHVANFKIVYLGNAFPPSFPSKTSFGVGCMVYNASARALLPFPQVLPC